MTPKHKNAFIEQTAIDYDMDYETVKQIYSDFPDTFYLRLEEHINDRAKRNET